MKITDLCKRWRMWLLITCLLLSYATIDYQSAEGISITAVTSNSSAELGGIQNPETILQPTQREKILTVQGKHIATKEEYTKTINTIKKGETITIKTDKQEYVLLKQTEDIGLTVTPTASSNLRKGLELQGGTRVLLKPAKTQGEITQQDIQDIIDVMSKRLNVYGLTDVTIKAGSDLSGAKFIIVEIAGATQEEVRELMEKQGVFEAKIGNATIFEGGKQDVTFVCRNDGSCSRIINCAPYGNEYTCEFQFEISLSGEAAKRHAETTKNLNILTTESGARVLEKNIDFYLDEKLVDSLQIAQDLKGQEATRITISGPGKGTTQEQAIQDAISNRNKLQTVLITGSLPTKLEIVKLDSISPTLGKEFLNNAILVGFVALLAVGIIILIRYRSLKISIPIMISVAAEIYIILGLAALFKYNLDLAAIAGIIASVGTGVDDLIVITDETISKKATTSNWKTSFKQAFFIILIAYVTTVAAMLPLLWAGAGLLTGFALTTIAGITIGILITRPAYATTLKIIFEK